MTPMTMSDRPDPKKPSLWRNVVSFIGMAVAAVSTLIGLPMMFMDLFSAKTNPYTGIFTYLLLPITAAIGVAIALAGLAWERWRRKKDPNRSIPRLPKLDLNQPRHRMVLAGAMSAILLIVILLSITGYRAYHFSDSVEFCGLACHSVMKPEFTAYQHSPHARVSCTACHIGPGASWFVKSKITGAYQIYSVMFEKYSRPIETPIKNLRPAQETCEQCHWPAKFFGAQKKTFTHYLSDENNTPWQIQTLLKIGGGDPDTGATSGIHWHMNIKNKIEYIDIDGEREIIPWVRSTDPEGRVTEYMSVENPLSPEELRKATIRRMDCVDCHNRPSHIFHPPSVALDDAFDSGHLDRSLPYIKREAMRLLIGEYATQAEGREAIRKGLSEFYQTDDKATSAQRQASVEQAIETVQALYSRNFFPEMKVDWRAHPNHIGHLITDGCFRCHDGLHQSSDGKVITNDCNVCHTILAQGHPDKITELNLKSQPFQHPIDLGTDVTQMKCSICHTGTTGL